MKITENVDLKHHFHQKDKYLTGFSSGGPKYE